MGRGGVLRLTNAQRETLGYRGPEWQQLRTARARVETGDGAGALGQTAGVGGTSSTTRGVPRAGVRPGFSLSPTADGAANTGSGAGVSTGQGFERRAAYRPGRRMAGSNGDAIGGGTVDGGGASLVAALQLAAAATAAPCRVRKRARPGAGGVPSSLAEVRRPAAA